MENREGTGGLFYHDGAMQILEEVPALLRGESVNLRYEKTVPGDESQGLVPFYHFKIFDLAGNTIGHINFRVGDTQHIRIAAGHIGYEIAPEYRGHGYSFAACRALAPFVRKHYANVILTVDPSNTPSIRVIEKLGAHLLDEVDIPQNDPAYANSARRKKRYRWVP